MFLLLIKALLATIVVEEFVAVFWKERSLRLVGVVLLVNLLTNPLVNVVYIYSPNFFFESNLRHCALLIFLELVVLLVETELFFRWIPSSSRQRAFYFALSLNAFSYFSGTVLSKLGYWN